MSTTDSPSIGEIYQEVIQRQEPMQTLSYQGRQIEAERVAYMSGALVITPWMDHDGDDDLLRDAAGRYYIRRELNWIDADGKHERQASGRTLAHRLSIKAAVLWATMRVNALTNDLRIDAAAALTGRTAEGNHLVTISLTPTQYAMVKRVAQYDLEPSVETWIKNDLERSIICSADCFEESQDSHQAAWDGKENA